MDNVPINQRWYQPYCKKCPYLINDEITKKLHCVRPAGEECLAEGILVAGVIMANSHNAKITKMYTDRDKKSADDAVVHKLSKRRRNKLPKRKR